MSTNILKIGTLFQKKRLAKGLSQAALGQKIGVGRSQICKIESGKPLSVSTIDKLSKALDTEVIVSLKETSVFHPNAITYIVAAISEFAAKHKMTHRQAANYLVRYEGISFLEENYEAEHTLSFRDCVEDLTAICKRNGGRLS